MTSLFEDLRFGLRVLRRNPGFTAATTFTLMLGVGATSAIFSLVDAAILRPLPFPRAGHLVMVAEVTPSRVPNSVSALNFLDWRDQGKSFDGMAAVAAGSVTLKSDAQPERIPGQQVSASYFDLLGVRALLGRTFEPADEEPANSARAVIAWSLWMRRFGGDPAIVGRPIVLNDRPYTVIGVLPDGFYLLNGRREIWTPLSLPRAAALRSSHFLQVLARLRPTASREIAQAEMDVIAARIAAASPETNKGWGASVVPLHEFIVGRDLKSTSLLLLAAVSLVLLIACVNVANLLLARRITRVREMAVRASVGAARGRLVRQMLTESLLLAAAGGFLGAWLAWIAIGAMPRLLPSGVLPAAISPQVDLRLILFTLATTIVTALLFGLAPAWQTANTSFSAALRAGGRGFTGSRRPLGILAAAEIALAIVVLAGAGLLVRTLFGLNNVDRGYRAENVLAMHVSLTPGRYPTPERTAQFYRDAERELSTVPGVRSVGIAIDLPLEGWSYGEFFQLVKGGDQTPGRRTGAHLQAVNAGYFDALGIRLQAGRAFTAQDTSRSKPVCIINEAFAKRFYPSESPVGALINVTGSSTSPDVREVVGVIRQVKVEGPGEPGALEIYQPMEQSPVPAAAIALRTAGDPLSLANAAGAAIRRVDPDLPVTGIGTLEAIADQSVSRPRMRAFLAAAFAAIAALLAVVGIFGVLSYAVSQRVREIGIRIALGAEPRSVLALVFGEGARIAAAGIAAGLIAAAAVTRYMASLIWGVTPRDPLTFIAAPALFLAVALLACAIPARRAATVDPVVILRED